MGLLAKIFGRKEYDFADRAPRVSLLPLHAINFQQTEPPVAKPLPLVNLSETGVGFLKDAKKDWEPSGSVVHGYFKIRRKQHPVSVRIAHHSSKVIGAEFIGDTSSDLREAIRTYFGLELTALKMTEVKPELLKEEPDGIPRWIRGENNCDLHFVMNDGHIVRFNLSFFGNYLEGGRELPLRYGKIIEEVRDDISHQDSEIMRWESHITQDMRDSVIKFLANVAQITPEERETIVGFIAAG